MRARVYIDGFNLFYGCLKGTSERWLDLEAFANRLAPKGATVDAVLYFTARVRARTPTDTSPIHQDAYLRALASCPKVAIHYGQFQTKRTRMPLVTPNGAQNTVEVFKTEEKGSDVNLASHLLLDASKGSFDVAMVITNDSDLATPIHMAIHEFGKRVILYPPATRPGRYVSKELLKIAGVQVREIRTAAIASSQLAHPVAISGGTVSCPSDWCVKPP